MLALLEASVLCSTELSLDSVLRRIAEAARDVLEAGAAAVGVMDDGGPGVRHVVTAGTGRAGPRAFGPPAGEPAAGRTVLGVPITVRGKAYAHLYASEKDDGSEFSEADETLAHLLAAQAGIAIDHAITFQALRETQRDLQERERHAMLAVKQVQALVQAGLALTAELSLEGVLQKIADAARDVLQARYAALGVIDERGTGLGQFVTSGLDEATKRAIGTLPTGRGVLGQLIRERRPLRIRDLSAHPASVGWPRHHPPMRSFLGVPITVRDKAYGNLYFADKEGAPEFSEGDLGLAQMLAAQAGMVIENAQTFHALREAQAELVRNERLATLGQLAGGVGHELRNPLGVIKNSIYFLNMILPENEKVQKHLAILDREVGTCNRIVTELLDFGRVKSAARTPTSVTALARDALDRVGLPPTVALRLLLDKSLPAVLVDPQQAGQILVNLLTNAVQAMPDGGTLAIETGRGEGGVFIAVEDTGTGIDPEHLPKIFQPLFTTKAKGIGLGLALAKDLAELNGAQIAVESQVGRGTRFELVLPEAPRE
jgi:signal transduction histidine kinase